MGLQVKNAGKNIPAFEGESDDDQVSGTTVEAETKGAKAQAAEAPAQAQTAEANTEVKQEPAAESKSAEATAEAPASNETAIAVAKPRGLAVLGAKLGANPYAEFENAIDLDVVRAFGAGTFPKLVAEPASLVLDKADLGGFVIAELQSTNLRWVVTPGSDDDEAKKLLRYSFDGERIEGSDQEGMLLTEWRDYLINEEGYKKADIRQYMDIWVILTESEKGGVIPEDQRELVQVQASPQSVRQWKKFIVNSAIRAARKGEVTGLIKMVPNRGEFDNKKFGYITFTPA